MGSHKEWRRQAKKFRRKRIRQKNAKLIAVQKENEQLLRESTTEYQAYLAEQKVLEELAQAELERLQDDENERWMRTELIAQQQWRQLQEKISKARLERAEQDLRIKKEWEEQQKKLKEAEEVRQKVEEERLKCHHELMIRIEEYTSGKGSLPDELLIGRESNPGKESCLFFSKTGTCRFGDNCSRNHHKPGVSKVLLANNFYLNFGIEHSTPNEYDTDILLEYDDTEMYCHFKEFFHDVYPEFNRLGKITQFKVCSNFERHLRGNVYVEYSSVREAVNAYRVFHGRWYGGKQVSLQFVNVPSWKRAICGLFSGKRCPKGRSCNFLHVFRNPGNLFNSYDTPQVTESKPRASQSSRPRSVSRSRSKENRCNWRWSESPVPDSQNSKKSRRQSSSKHKESRPKKDDDVTRTSRSRRLRSVSRSRDEISNKKSHSVNEKRSSRSNGHHKSKKRKRSKSVKKSK